MSSSVEALWTVEYETVAGWKNGGVVVLETGRLFGGDNQYYHLGRFELKGETFTGTVHTEHHSGERVTARGDRARQVEATFTGSLKR